MQPPLILKEWTIEQGIFQPFHLTHLSFECWQIIGALRRLQLNNHLLYLRGSIVEESSPHPKADLDVVLIGDTDCSDTLREVLQFSNRPLDIHYFTPEGLRSNLRFQLLLSTRSIPVNGPTYPFYPIRANKDTAQQLWKEYNPVGMYSTLSNHPIIQVCQTKVLIRSAAIFMLLQDHRFSRNLQTCLHWIQRNVPQDVYQDYQQLWYHMNTQWKFNDNFSLRPIQDWLARKAKECF